MGCIGMGQLLPRTPSALELCPEIFQDVPAQTIKYIYVARAAAAALTGKNNRSRDLETLYNTPIHNGKNPLKSRL
jgi:hypothetical protein